MADQIHSIFQLLKVVPFLKSNQEEPGRCPDDCIFTIMDNASKGYLDVDGLKFNKDDNETLLRVLIEFHEHSGTHTSECPNYCSYHSVFHIAGTQSSSCKSFHSDELGRLCMDVKLEKPDFWNSEYFTKAFDRMHEGNCTVCNEPCTNTFSVDRPPSTLIIQIQTSIQIACIQSFYVLRSFPLVFPCSQLFVSPQEFEYKLSGMLLKKNEEYVSLTMTEKRTWLKYTRGELSEGSLFDWLIILIPEGFSLFYAIYNQQPHKPFPILESAWKRIEAKVIAITGIWTCKCGKITDMEKCQNCDIAKKDGTDGWACNCGKTNIIAQCSCVSLYKCQKCGFYTRSLDQCENCRDDVKFQCKACMFISNGKYSICKNCMNPFPELFEGYNYFPRLKY